MYALLKDKTVLVTGGTGSFGQHFVRAALNSDPRKVIVLSRDEWKQSEMMRAFNSDSRLRCFLGDVRDEARLRRAFHGVDYVIHAAALKQVPALEYNPFEAVQTNVVGGHNVISAAIETGVKNVIALSTDKAVNPINLYGATKLCAEKLFVAANAYAASHETRFSIVRYGNVIGSRGSVIPLFLERRSSGVLPITDERMTRFWITLDQAVDLVMLALRDMQGGEVFVPKVRSMRIVDLARVLAPDCRLEYVGVRAGEKIHEVLLTEDESPRSLDMGNHFLIKPTYPVRIDMEWNSGKPLPSEFRYSSDNNAEWLRPHELADMVAALA